MSGQWALRIVLGSALTLLVFANIALASGTPPTGVWTCDYIASHPVEAAVALVSCDPRGPIVMPEVNTQSAPLTTSAAPAVEDVQPCKSVPLDGTYVSRGVFAWSDLHYFNRYSYAPAVIQTFTYYVQRQDGVNVQWGSDDVANSHTVGANYFYWGAQNNGDQIQKWTFCWAVR